MAAHAQATQVHAEFRGNELEGNGHDGRAGPRSARRAQEDAQDVRSRQEEDGHRRSDGAAAAAECFFCACTTELGDVRERER